MSNGVVAPKFVELIIFSEQFLIQCLNISDSLYDKIAEFSSKPHTGLFSY
jgi:hypothetical protein